MDSIFELLQGGVPQAPIRIHEREIVDGIEMVEVQAEFGDEAQEYINVAKADYLPIPKVSDPKIHRDFMVSTEIQVDLVKREKGTCNCHGDIGDDRAMLNLYCQGKNIGYPVVKGNTITGAGASASYGTGSFQGVDFQTAQWPTKVEVDKEAAHICMQHIILPSPPVRAFVTTIFEQMSIARGDEVVWRIDPTVITLSVSRFGIKSVYVFPTTIPELGRFEVMHQHNVYVAAYQVLPNPKEIVRAMLGRFRLERTLAECRLFGARGMVASVLLTDPALVAIIKLVRGITGVDGRIYAIKKLMRRVCRGVDIRGLKPILIDGVDIRLFGSRLDDIVALMRAECKTKDEVCQKMKVLRGKVYSEGLLAKWPATKVVEEEGGPAKPVVRHVTDIDDTGKRPVTKVVARTVPFEFGDKAHTVVLETVPVSLTASTYLGSATSTTPAVQAVPVRPVQLGTPARVPTNRVDPEVREKQRLVSSVIQQNLDIPMVEKEKQPELDLIQSPLIAAALAYLGDTEKTSREVVKHLVTKFAVEKRVVNKELHSRQDVLRTYEKDGIRYWSRAKRPDPHAVTKEEIASTADDIKAQIAVLEKMGFLDRMVNIRAIVAAGGDIAKAVSSLLGD